MGKATFSPRRASPITPSAPGHFLTTNQANQEASKGIPREKPHSYKPELHATLSSTFSGSTTYGSDFNRSSVSPTRAPRPKDNFHSNPAVPGAFETTNMVTNSVVQSAHLNHTIQRPAPFLKFDHGALNAPTIGLESPNSTYRSEFLKKPMTRGSSPNRRFVPVQVVSSPDTRDFATSNSVTYRSYH